MPTKTSNWREINSTEHRCIIGNRYLLIVESLNLAKSTFRVRVCLGHEATVLADSEVTNTTLAGAKSTALTDLATARALEAHN